VIGVVAFAFLAPVALIALPVAALIVASRPKRLREWIIAGAAAGMGLAWLLIPGELPDQLLRAATVLGTAVFVALTIRTHLSFIHRALASVAATTMALAGLVPLAGTSWGGIRWWVEHQTGLSARALVGTLWSVGSENQDAYPTLVRLQQGFEQVVALIAELYPALLVLQLTAGLGLATAIVHRVSASPVGRPIGRFRDFRFSEHLGWAAAIPLVALIIPTLVAAKTAAANLLFVMGTLFALRGAAVAAFGFGVVGIGGAFTWALIAVAVFFLLPVAIGGVIVLGVIDAGLDLRRRWRSSPQ
jgi:hypothetical protein